MKRIRPTISSAAIFAFMMTLAAADALAQTDPAPPDSPRDITACAGNNRITLEWLPPTDAGWKRHRRVGYQVRHGNDDAFYRVNVFSPYASVRKVTINAGTYNNNVRYATNGQTETWQVRTVAEVYGTGTGSGSDITDRDKIYSAWADAPAVTIGQAAQPTNLTVTPGLHKLDLSWKAAACSAPVTGYDVHYTSNATVAADAAAVSDAATGWVAASRGSPGSTRETLDDDSNAGQLAVTRFRVRVRAVTANGPGSWSAVRTGAPKTTVSFKFAAVVETNEVSTDVVRMALVAGRNNAFGGTLAYNRVSGSEPAASIPEDLVSRSTTYNFDSGNGPDRETIPSTGIQAKDDDINEYDEILIVSLVETPQLIPTGIVTKTIRIKDGDPVTDPVNNFRNVGGVQQFTASWTKPSSCMESGTARAISCTRIAGPVTAYELIWRKQAFSNGRPVVGDPEDANAGWTTVPLPGDSLSHTVENLEHGTRYEVYVRARDDTKNASNAFIWGPWSQQGAVSTERDPNASPPEVTPQDPNPEAIRPPQNITAVSSASGALKVAWRGTNSLQAEPCIYRYRVILTHQDAVQEVSGPPTDQPWTCAHEYDFTGLRPGRYDVSVVASVVNNVGARSDPITVIVAGGPVLSLARTGRRTRYYSDTDTWRFEESPVEEILDLSLSSPLTTASTVRLEAVPGTCTKLACAQLYAGLPATITLPAGQTSIDINMSDYLVNDNITNQDKIRGSFRFRLVRPPNVPYALADIEAETLVLEDGNKLTLSFGTPNNLVILEGSTADIKVIADREADFLITVQLRTRADMSCEDLSVVDNYDADACSGFTAGDTALHPSTTADATRNEDYTDPGNLMVVLPAHKREVEATIRTTADRVVEDGDNEFFIVWMPDPGVERVEVGPDVAVVQIVDEALVSFVKTEAANWSAANGRFEYTEEISQASTTTNGVTTYSEHGKLKLALSRALDHDARVRVELVPDSCSDTDCTAYKGGLPVTVTFAEDETEAEIDFAHDHLRANNLQAEATATFQIRLAYPSGLHREYSIKDTAPETVQLTDDDVVTLSFSPASYTVSEGIPATMGINADKVSNFDIPITISTRPDQYCSDVNDDQYSNGSIDPDTCAPPDNAMVSFQGPKPDLGNPADTPDAELDVDYRVPNPTTILQAGSQRTVIVVATLRDAVVNERDEVLIVTMDIPQDIPGRVEVGPDNGLVVISDSTTVLNLSASKTEVTEGESITITVRPAGGHGTILDFSLSTDQGDSEQGDFRINPTSQELPAGIAPIDFTIETTVDTDTDDEMFTVGLGNLPPGYAAGPSIGITIKDLGAQQQIAKALTVAMENIPPEHDGNDPFTIDLRFSEALDGGVAPTAASFRAQLGSVDGIERVSAGLWRVRVQPKNWKDVTVTFVASVVCAATGAVCTADGRAPSNTVTATIRGPVRIRIDGARAREGKDESLDFVVTLSRPPAKEVSVDYATADGTATAGSDYSAMSGTLAFAPGDIAKFINVPVLDDAVDEGKETMFVKLSNPQGAYLRNIHRQARGIIVNDDPLQKMWLSRFGRTVGGHLADAVSDRLSGGLTPGAHATVAGRGVDLSRTNAGKALADTLTGLARHFGAEAPADGGPFARHGAGGEWNAPASTLSSSPAPAASSPARSMTDRELLLGSSFHLADEGDGSGPGLAAWGRVANGSFDGEEGSDGGRTRIDGEVVTGTLGADADFGRVLAGVAVSLSEGDGTFDSPGVDTGQSGGIENTLTTVSPYARVRFTERTSAWGLAGLGTGDMTIRFDDGAMDPIRTDVGLRMGALGARGVLLEQDGTGGMDLALKADAFFVRMDSEKAVNSVETEADASRVRLVLQGGRAFDMGAGARLRPSLELGVRHDGGDAETGAGVEFGAGVAFIDAASGLGIEAKWRMLVAHADSDYEEWGASATARLDPGMRGRGLSFSLAPTLGATSSASERLWGARDARALAPVGGEFEASRGLTAEAGYGLALFGDRFTGTPNVGFGLADGGPRDYRIGWRLTSAAEGDSGFRVNFDAVRREAANGNAPPEHGVMLRGAIRW